MLSTVTVSDHQNIQVATGPSEPQAEACNSPAWSYTTERGPNNAISTPVRSQVNE